MERRIKVVQDKDSRFMIVHRDPSTEEEKFFAGFYNEASFPGTEDESFSYGMKALVDRPEDGAMMFKTYGEAKEFMDAIHDNQNCHITLYGRHDVENFMLGSHWYPLQDF